MRGRQLLGRGEPGVSLPVLDRIAPPPPPDLVAAQIERHSAPGDIVVDLHGRGGWIARAAIDRGRRALTLESSPLTRLVAEIVLRPPDIRHLDAAFQALAASPRGQSSLRIAVGEAFATHCPTCSRSLNADDIVWVTPAGPAGTPPVPYRKIYRCVTCRDQQGGSEQRQAPLDDADRARAEPLPAAAATRAALRDRFPVPPGAGELVDQLLDLHTDRQLVGLGAILQRIDEDRRAEPVEAALRLAFLEAILPASRLATGSGRLASLRISNGRVRVGADQWRERNPWLAFEEGFRLVRTFVQRLDGDGDGPVQARFGVDVRSLTEGAATTVVRVASPPGMRALEAEARELAARPGRPRVRLILGQPPVRPSQEAIALSYLLTAWVLGREAAGSVPIEPLLGPPVRVPWGWQAAALRRSLEAVEPLLDADGRAVLVVESSGPEALVAAAIGGAGAGFRLVDARMAEAGPAEPGPAEPRASHAGAVELARPGAILPPGPRTRANVALPPLPGGAGDPGVVPGRGVFGPPEKVDGRPFSAVDAARLVTESAVEVLLGRGEAASTEQLLGEILVALDRAGQLRRLADSAPPAATPAGSGVAVGPGRGRGHHRDQADITDPVERLLAVVHDELTRPTQRRLVEVEPDHWWLGERDERAAAALPLADRVEWAVYSLLSTGGPLSEAAFLDRIAGLFGPHEMPDEGLVRACLDSYRGPASTPERLVTDEDLLRRSQEHAELLGALAEGGHRLGMQVWLARREQSRRVGERRLGELLDDGERASHLPAIVRGRAEDVEAVDCIWYVRSSAAFLFEVEWTAMLGEPVLRRHGRIPPDERLVRFVVVPAERTELIRHKLARSPVLRAAIDSGNWHVLKWDHLRTFLAGDAIDLAGLEPFLGLDPLVERNAEQLPLFVAGR
ncbi:MAG TPA: hypothetical protein VGQ58_05620 [Candidatus Limnocylindrales bacterium]|nr:hypothetical protein [Candidatus Limnocylindrales bacterium]